MQGSESVVKSKFFSLTQWLQGWRERGYGEITRPDEIGSWGLLPIWASSGLFKAKQWSSRGTIIANMICHCCSYVNHLLHILITEICFGGSNVDLYRMLQFYKNDFMTLTRPPRPPGWTAYPAAAIFQSQYNLMRMARWLRSGAAVNIRFLGTDFRRGPFTITQYSGMQSTNHRNIE